MATTHRRDNMFLALSRLIKLLLLECEQYQHAFMYLINNFDRGQCLPCVIIIVCLLINWPRLSRMDIIFEDEF